MKGNAQRLPVLCALAGAIVFNLAGYALEQHVLTGTSFAFKGVVGLVAGYAVGLLISKVRRRA